jgi:DNA polymerase IV
LLYNEWKHGGGIQELATAEEDSRISTLKLFSEIWGVGATTAREFYNKGWRDVDDIVEYGWESLSRVQQIGVKFYDELLIKMPRAEVESIANIKHTKPKKTRTGYHMIIAGGYRRGKSGSGDVDVVISHKEEDKTENFISKLVTDLQDARFITHTLTISTRNSERGQVPLPWKGNGRGAHAGFDTLDKALVVWQDPDQSKVDDSAGSSPHRRVDIIISPWKTVGCAVLGWSGANTFERDLRRYCKQEKGLKFDSSGIRSRTDGHWVDLENSNGDPAPDIITAERRVFEGLGLEFRPPEERCTD